MEKWYEGSSVDTGVVISSRVRLARNLKKYPFSVLLNNENAERIINEIKGSVINDRNILSDKFQYVDVNSLSEKEKLSLMEQHIISPILVNKTQNCGVLIKEDETVNIMINEEDHIRIQAVYPSENIDKAWDTADKIDNLVEESVEYAFDDNFGYMTSCPTNVGTGLRASYMMHLPWLEGTGQIRNIIQEISKFGITVRGTYGEGSEAVGSIYQISNQVTLGQSEDEILRNLKNVATLVIEQEKKINDKVLKERRTYFEDKIYRSYGILTNARQISTKEAMNHLSNIREGFINEILTVKKPKKSIYDIMMHIQSGSLQKFFNGSLNNSERDIIRSNYIREQFGV